MKRTLIAIVMVLALSTAHVLWADGSEYYG